MKNKKNDSEIIQDYKNLIRDFRTKELTIGVHKPKPLIENEKKWCDYIAHKEMSEHEIKYDSFGMFELANEYEENDIYFYKYKVPKN